LLLHQVPLVLLAVLVLLAQGITRLWRRYCLDRVEYRHRLSAHRIFFGDEVQLEVEVANRKPLPLPWIKVSPEVPPECEFLTGATTPSYRYTRLQLSSLLSLGWYHKVTRRYRLRCRHRGCFTFGPTRIRSGDPFGFSEREMEIQQMEYLTVYPKIVPLEKLSIPSHQPIGDILTRRHIFEDPVLTTGVRDYHFGDSLKKIHWKTTARLGRLQTKLFQPTTTIDMALFLDVRTVKPPTLGQVTSLLELAIITAASLANEAMAAGYRVGLYANQKRRFSGKAISLPPSQHPDQLALILEALAQIPGSFQAMPLARLLPYESRSLPWGSTVVAITAAPTENLVTSLFSLKRAGRRVALVLVGDFDDGISHNGLAVYHVPGNIDWTELEKLELTMRSQ